MSSHHIIRENQEAALILANGQSCSDELLHSLLEWSPYVLVLDGALERALMKGIKVDAVLGDFDSLGSHPDEVESSQTIEWVHTPDQDKTDLEKGIEWLLNRGHEKANVLWGTGKRLDHTWNNILSMAKYAGEIQVNLMDDHSRCFILPQIFQKFYPKGTKLSLMPITDIQNIKTSGLKYELNNSYLKVPERTSSSNESLEDGMVKINYESGILSLIESFD